MQIPNTTYKPVRDRTAHRRRIVVPAIALLGVAILGLGTVSPANAESPAPARNVATLEYNLGAKSFSVPDLKDEHGRPSPMELQARVHLPAHAARGRHPVVVLVPGYWPTCADAKAQKVTENPKSTDAALVAAYGRLNQWPCPRGIGQIPSYRGFDYLARALANAGDVVISIGANGANAIDSRSFEGDQARAALISKHLRLWKQFDTTGRGPLTTKLPASLRGHLDLGHVGLLGHSRAGRAVLQYAADHHQRQWPTGVHIRAVLALAPASGYGNAPDTFTNTGTTLGIIGGSCDGVSNPPYNPYFAAAVNGSRHPAYRWLFRGANHDFFNAQWSPSSGQVGAHDDADHPAGRAIDCFETSSPADAVTQLSEHTQRNLTTRYVAAFFGQTLQHRHDQNSLLDGTHPLAGVTTETRHP